jgi:hypothetical protein
MQTGKDKGRIGKILVKYEPVEVKPNLQITGKARHPNAKKEDGANKKVYIKTSESHMFPTECR